MALRPLLRGLGLLCPHCGLGRLFSPPLRMLPACSVCGLVFFQRPGEFTGALMLAQGFFMTLGLVGFVFFAAAWRWPLEWGVAWFAVTAVLVPPFLYRNVKGLWVAILFVTGASKAPSTGAESPRVP